MRKEACPFGVVVKTDDTPYASSALRAGICAKICPVENPKLSSNNLHKTGKR
jgi:hypothetical protein